MMNLPILGYIDNTNIYTLFYGLSDWIMNVVAWILNWLFRVPPGTNDFTNWLVSPGVVQLVNYLIVAVVVFIVAFLMGLTVIWMERKCLGRFMDRRGTQVGVLGLFQNFADGIKTMLKEIIIPKDADAKLYTWSVVLIIACSAMLLGLVPWSDRFYAVNVPLALLLGLAVFSLAPLAILMGGWSSNNKYTVIGGMRAAAQLIAYEVPLLLCVVSVVVMVGSLNFNDIVNYQEANGWLIVPLIIGAFTFFVAALAEVERVPFDLPEAEAELVEGWQTEYGGFRWGLIMLCDYLRAYIASALFAILFLGGWTLPYNLGTNTFIFPELFFALKTLLVFFIMIWVRAAMVRIRTDQILKIGWRRLLPLGVINLFVAIAFKMAGVL
jgi:NADH-quinone oxidoreductase subunit H